MTDAALAAILALFGSLLLASLGYIVALLIRLNRRIRELERRDRLNWLYIQSLIAHAYKHLATPLPSPPAGWDELID